MKKEDQKRHKLLKLILQMKISIQIIIFVILPIFIYAQNDSLTVKKSKFNSITDTKALTLLFGFNGTGSFNNEHRDSSSRCFLEIGIHKTRFISTRHGISTYTWGLSTLAEVGKNNDKVYGIRVGAWTGYLLALGISATYYTDFQSDGMKITPEFGFGMGPFRLTIGYNFPVIDNKEFTQMKYTTSQITLNYHFIVKTLKKEIR